MSPKIPMTRLEGSRITVIQSDPMLSCSVAVEKLVISYSVSLSFTVYVSTSSWRCGEWPDVHFILMAREMSTTH